jgi:hypothetical protein
MPGMFLVAKGNTEIDRGRALVAVASPDRQIHADSPTRQRRKVSS